METTKLPNTTLSKAITALLNHHSSKTQSQNPQLLPSDNFIYLVLTLQKIPPKPRTTPFKIPLPHPLYPPLSTDICLIVDDSHTPSKTIKQKIADESILIDKVLKFSKLKSDYKAYESKRKLCDSYDLFLCDKRVTPLLGKFIGKYFYKKRKVPLGVNLGKKDWKLQVERLCGSGLVFLGNGSCVVVKVGRVSMEENEILENLRVVVDGVVGIFGGKWENVRSLHLKLTYSVALPLYQCLPKMVLKIDGGVGGNVSVEGNEGNVSGSESEGRRGGKRKKGRIHEVMYMDNVSMIGGEDVDDENEDGVVEEGEMGSVENRGSKRKKSDGDEKNKKGVKKVAKVKNVDDGVMMNGEENEVGDGSKEKKSDEEKKNKKKKGGDKGLKEKKVKVSGDKKKSNKV